MSVAPRARFATPPDLQAARKAARQHGCIRYFPDLRWPKQRLIVEVDSAWHDGHIAQELDAARQAELEAAGERVLRTTRERTLADPRQLVTRLLAAGAPLARGGPQNSALH